VLDTWLCRDPLPLRKPPPSTPLPKEKPKEALIAPNLYKIAPGIPVG